LASGDEGERGHWTTSGRPLQTVFMLFGRRTKRDWRFQEDVSDTATFLQELVESAMAATSGSVCAFLAHGDESVEIALDGPEKLVIANRLIELFAARRMPDDLKITDEPEEPEEPTDIDPDERDDHDDPDAEDIP
jgi:hypothetical protein